MASLFAYVCNSMMEVFQLKTNSWFLSKQLFVEDPLLSTQQKPIFCHILTGTLALSLPHIVSVVNYDEHLFKYLWRYKAKENIVHIYNVTLERVVRNDAIIRVMCEKLCFDVEKIINLLTVEQQLYILGQIIRNARILSNSFGFFGLATNMMGIDKNGEFKMWINQNYADNRRQKELESEEQQFLSIIQLFQTLKVQNKLINAYLQNFRDMRLGFNDFAGYHDNFVRLHHLKVKSKVNVGKINLQKSSIISFSKELESRPPSSLKISNETTDMTSSFKEYPLHCRASEPISFPLCKSSEFPKSIHGVPKIRQKMNKQNRKHLQKRHKQPPSEKQPQKQSTTQNMAYLQSRAKLQESVVIQDDVKLTQIDINSLQLLGKMGKFCLSMTPEELILEQFKQIYQ